MLDASISMTNGGSDITVDNFKIDAELEILDAETDAQQLKTWGDFEHSPTETSANLGFQGECTADEPNPCTNVLEVEMSVTAAKDELEVTINNDTHQPIINAILVWEVDDDTGKDTLTLDVTGVEMVAGGEIDLEDSASENKLSMSATAYEGDAKENFMTSSASVDFGGDDKHLDDFTVAVDVDMNNPEDGTDVLDVDFDFSSADGLCTGTLTVNFTDPEFEVGGDRRLVDASTTADEGGGGAG